MAFVLEPISDAAVRTAISNSLHVYQGNWAIDHSRNACLYFRGNDVLDPQIPHEYVLLLNGQRYSLQVIDSAYSAEADKSPTGQLSYVVIGTSVHSPLAPNELHTIVVEALKALTERTTPEYRVLDMFQQRAEPIHTPTISIANPSWSSYRRALVPFVFFLLFGLFVLFVESNKH